MIIYRVSNHILTPYHPTLNPTHPTPNNTTAATPNACAFRLSTPVFPHTVLPICSTLYFAPTFGTGGASSRSVRFDRSGMYLKSKDDSMPARPFSFSMMTCQRMRRKA